MKQKYHYIILLLISFNTSCAQTKEIKMAQSQDYSAFPCSSIMNKELENSLITILGKDFVINSLNTNENRIYVSITLDSLSKVVDAKILKSKNLTLEQITQIETDLKTKTLCLINSDPHLTLEEFIRIGNNRYKYTLPYIYKTDE